jgi:hypothetical protein
MLTRRIFCVGTPKILGLGGITLFRLHVYVSHLFCFVSYVFYICMDFVVIDLRDLYSVDGGVGFCVLHFTWICEL